MWSVYLLLLPALSEPGEKVPLLFFAPRGYARTSSTSVSFSLEYVRLPLGSARTVAVSQRIFISTSRTYCASCSHSSSDLQQLFRNIVKYCFPSFDAGGDGSSRWRQHRFPSLRHLMPPAWQIHMFCTPSSSMIAVFVSGVSSPTCTSHFREPPSDRGHEAWVRQLSLGGWRLARTLDLSGSLDHIFLLTWLVGCLIFHFDSDARLRASSRSVHWFLSTFALQVVLVVPLVRVAKLRLDKDVLQEDVRTCLLGCASCARPYLKSHSTFLPNCWQPIGMMPWFFPCLALRAGAWAAPAHACSKTLQTSCVVNCLVSRTQHCCTVGNPRLSEL